MFFKAILNGIISLIFSRYVYCWCVGRVQIWGCWLYILLFCWMYLSSSRCFLVESLRFFFMYTIISTNKSTLISFCLLRLPSYFLVRSLWVSWEWNSSLRNLLFSLPLPPSKVTSLKKSFFVGFNKFSLFLSIQTMPLGCSRISRALHPFISLNLISLKYFWVNFSLKVLSFWGK